MLCASNPVGRSLSFITPATPAAIDRAIDAAEAAQKIWANTTFRERRKVLRSMLQFVLDNQGEICRVACKDSGKTMVDAQLGEISVTVEKLQWTIKYGEKALAPSRRPTNLLMMYKKNVVIYEPLVVVAALVSLIYPFHNLIGPIISSIFSGNGILVKASEQTAWSASFLASIARGALVANGHDPALIQTTACWPEIANHITSHPKIAHITFVGSRPVAHKVAESAVKALILVVAELGDKDACMVLDSAKSDLYRVVETLLRGTFQAAGQNCIGIERIIATPGVYDELVKRLEPPVKALRLGTSRDVGAVISDASFDRLEGLIRNAFKKGARLLGKRSFPKEAPSGYYFSPTLLADVTPDMEIANEECFGPIMVLMRAPSNSASAVLDSANAPNFGLGASVFGKESDPVLKAIVKGVRSGMVAINDFAVFYAVQLPFDGVGGSGYGRFAGEEGLRGLCNTKAICSDRWGWAGVKKGIPQPMQYPIDSQVKSWRFAKGIVETGYDIGITREIGGVRGILKNM